MNREIERRLEELRDELQKGGRRLEELAREHSKTEQTMLRIDGAIQLAEELLARDSAEAEATRADAAA